MGIALGAKFRIRFAIKETAAGDPPSQAYSLYYSKNSGAWTVVGAAAADAPIRVTDGAVADNTATTQQISSGTFTAGFYEEATAATNALDLGRSGLTEFEWCCEVNAAASSPFVPTDVVRLRVQIGSTALDVYSKTAQFTVVAGGPVYQPRDAETFHDFR